MNIKGTNSGFLWEDFRPQETGARSPRIVGLELVFYSGDKSSKTWWPVNCTTQQSVKHGPAMTDTSCPINQSTRNHKAIEQLSWKGLKCCCVNPRYLVSRKIELKYPLILSASSLELAVGSKEDSFLVSVTGLLLSHKLGRLWLFKDMII